MLKYCEATPPLPESQAIEILLTPPAVEYLSQIFTG